MLRTAARTAAAVSQDDASLRAALSARPRVERDFAAGDFAYYWRSQKYIRGARRVGGRLYGAAIVMGKIGRNILIFHRQHVQGVPGTSPTCFGHRQSDGPI